MKSDSESRSEVSSGGVGSVLRRPDVASRESGRRGAEISAGGDRSSVGGTSERVVLPLALLRGCGRSVTDGDEPRSLDHTRRRPSSSRGRSEGRKIDRRVLPVRDVLGSALC